MSEAILKAVSESGVEVYQYLRTPKAQYLVACLDLPAASGVEDAVWEQFQLDHLNLTAKFAVTLKSRQVAWSWTVSAEAVALAHLSGESTAFVSINQDESQEKIRYAKAVHQNLQGVRVPRIVRDNLTMLEFENGARIISHASTPIRGKARFRVVMDELAHVMHDRAVYTGSLPVITKGGEVRLGSSPLGASGVFWEIQTESLRRYPRYARHEVPWFHVRALVGDADLGPEERHALFLRCLQDAHLMTTQERVEVYGSETIRELFDSLPLEDFQQEFECRFVDDAQAWITWPEIQSCQDPSLVSVRATSEGKETTAARLAIEELVQKVQRGEIEAVLGAGYDVGRTRNASELTIVGMGKQVPGHPPRATVRALITLKAMPFGEQFSVLKLALARLPIIKLNIDRNGLGMQLAEDLENEEPGIAEGVQFTNEAKVVWATAAKVAFQKQTVTIPVDRDLAYQVHSVKRKISPGGRNLIFDVAKNEKHHADMFWSLCLALDALPRTSGTGLITSYLQPQDDEDERRELLGR